MGDPYDFRDPPYLLREEIMENTFQHTVDSVWRGAEAVALETKVTAINDWIEHTEDLVEMFEADEEVKSQLRSTAGVLRSRRNDFDTSAARLRAGME